MSEVCIELEEMGKSDATINRVVSAVSTVLNHCAFDGLISKAPSFRRRKENECRKTFFTKEEVDRLYFNSIDPFQREELAEIILVGAYTGMRQGELFKLNVRDIDMSLNVIHVGGRPDVTTKAGNYRTIPIHDRIARVLTRRIDGIHGNVKVFGDEWRDKDQLLRQFKKVRNLIGKGDDYVFHSLRHSFGTWCAEAGVPLLTIKDLMGHKRIETTMMYSKVTDQARTTAIDLL
jgi:integrase